MEYLSVNKYFKKYNFKKKMDESYLKITKQNYIKKFFFLPTTSNICNRLYIDVLQFRVKITIFIKRSL